MVIPNNKINIGLQIAHTGTIIINNNAIIGKKLENISRGSRWK